MRKIIEYIIFIALIFIIIYFVNHKRDKNNLLDIRDNYIELMKKIILNSIYEDGPWIIDGRSWPPGKALTMVGTRRLNNIHMLIKRVIDNRVEGDIIEAGCWRGGSMMFARATLNAYNERQRKVYMCDSFSGIPQMPNSKYLSDKNAYTMKILNNNPVEDVYNMLKKLNLDKGTIVVKGYFNETLEKIPAQHFSIIRLDGDTYISTMQSMIALYPKLKVGGYIIIDDYLSWKSCKDAITDYRKKYNIIEKIMKIFHEKNEHIVGVYWKKEKYI